MPTKRIAGVDEAGRGPLAGPVVAAAVILDAKQPIEGLADSKILTAEEREILYAEIIAKCLAYAVGHADVNEIDLHNIFQANLLAMKRAVMALPIQPDAIQVDGTHCPAVSMPSQAIIKGDSLIPAISAASIIAKVTRDREMIRLDGEYPGYGFAAHKGYSTGQHLAALKALGPCAVHRKSFAPVWESVQMEIELFSQEAMDVNNSEI